MNIEELKAIVKENGVVGAGGAGFPSYAKMTDKAEIVILNCVECEPLLKPHRQFLYFKVFEIVEMLNEVREAMGAKEAVIGIKDAHVHTIAACREVIKEYPFVRVCPVRSTYPMGDEVILIYETTGRVIKPGGIPIDENVVVFNTETMYNIYRAVHENAPVYTKLLSVVGEVEKPVSIFAPVGATVGDVVKAAGGVIVKEPAYVMGGPMMGRPGSEDTLITKTTNAVIVLSKEHQMIRRMVKNIQIEKRRASSSCCQCRTCTDLCPRHALGHPIEPHSIMRAVANNDTSDLSVFINSAYCSSCGLCENYSCPQGLSPRSVIAEFKKGLREAGIRAEKIEKPCIVDRDRELKKVPVKRLKAKVGLYSYDVPAPFADEVIEVQSVRIPMSQHIGAPATPIVKPGDRVRAGQKIGEAPAGLGVAVHSSIDGTVVNADSAEVVIRRE
ncbi:MAG: 4Fe-4S dicluster domain-containing protein [Lachnospiraceae bacterium]|nr:4Fe-4S dicluster domain-containing protein [Lachnospiraceae bacterium]